MARDLGYDPTTAIFGQDQIHRPSTLFHSSIEFRPFGILFFLHLSDIKLLCIEEWPWVIRNQIGSALSTDFWPLKCIYLKKIRGL